MLDLGGRDALEERCAKHVAADMSHCDLQLFLAYPNAQMQERCHPIIPIAHPSILDGESQNRPLFVH